MHREHRAFTTPRFGSAVVSCRDGFAWITFARTMSPRWNASRMSSMYSSEIFDTWIAPSVSPVISRFDPCTAEIVASAIELRMSEITPYTTSPVFSSARGLKGRTRATKFPPSSSRSPGIAA